MDSSKFLFLFCYIIAIIFHSDAKSIETNCDISRNYYYPIRATLETCFIEEIKIQDKTTKLIFNFDKTKNVTAVNFRKSEIQVLPMEVFDQFPNLLILELELLGISEIKEKSFVNATHLQQLHLDLNRLTEVGDGIFDGAWDLRHLELSRNNIKKVSPNAFHSLEKLKHLGLSGNEITVLDKDTFAGLQNLKSLYLYSNHIKTLHPLIVIRNEKLEELDMDRNELEEVDLYLNTKVMTHFKSSFNSLKKIILR